MDCESLLYVAENSFEMNRGRTRPNEWEDLFVNLHLSDEMVSCDPFAGNDSGDSNRPSPSEGSPRDVEEGCSLR